MIITIDGPTASGKSTVAQLLAEELDCVYINSGLMFRGVAFLFKQANIDPTSDDFDDKVHEFYRQGIHGELSYQFSEDDGAEILFEDENITSFLKTKELDELSSIVAQHPLVREHILLFQQEIAEQTSLVTDGRDCGTAVFPKADYKFFLTADLTIRAQRWQQDQKRNGQEFSLEESERIVAQRDLQDAQREIAPLAIPFDAVLIDSTAMSIDEVLEECLSFIDEPEE